MAAKTLQSHIEDMIEHDESIPAPSQLDEIMADPDHRDGVTMLIDVSVRQPAIRTNVSRPPDLPQATKRVSDNRSRFLADAARERLRHA